MRTAKRLTTHALRHTTATLALSMGFNIASVGELLRQADLNTTRRYLHLIDTRRREAVRRLGTLLPCARRRPPRRRTLRDELQELGDDARIAVGAAEVGARKPWLEGVVIGSELHFHGVPVLLELGHAPPLARIATPGLGAADI
jgi:hypothetical protein